MERNQSQADKRLERFRDTGQRAKDLGDQALKSIDSVLAEEEQLRESLEVGVRIGTLTPEDVSERLAAYHQARLGNRSTP